MHRYAPTSPSAFNHKKKPLLPGCDRHPSRSLARGAQQQPSPPHSGRGHSTAYTHRHFPLPSLVQDCSDDPLALAQAQTPHMPQYVSLRLWLPDNAPSALVDVLAQTPTHISRLTSGSYRTYLIARHRPTKTQPLALSQARKSPHRESRQPLSSFAYPLTQYFNAIIARTTAVTLDFKELALPLVLE